MNIRIGIAGCGSHALGRILPALAANPGFHLAAVWARNPATRALLRERGISQVHAEFNAFLAADMDVVYIASPTGCHFAHAAAVLRSGRHAWVEKPLASRAGDARALVALAAQQGRMLAECFMFPWHEQARAIRQTLAQKLLGELRAASLTFCFPHLQPGNFRYEPALGGGAWLDHGCYLVKALGCYLPGNWQLVGGWSDTADHAVDIRGAALLRRASDGMTASLDWGFGQQYVNELQVRGSDGRMLVESPFTKPASRSCNLVLEHHTGQCQTVAIAHGDAYASMLAGFAAQLTSPADWAVISQEILTQAEQFFDLYEALQQASPRPARQASSHAE